MSAKEDPYQRQDHHHHHHQHELTPQRFNMEEQVQPFDAAAVAVATGFEDGPSAQGAGGGSGVLDPEISRQYAQQSSFFPMSLQQGQYRSLQKLPQGQRPPQQPHGGMGLALQTTQTPLAELESGNSLKENAVQFMGSKHQSPSSSSGRSEDASRETLQILQMAASMSNSNLSNSSLNNSSLNSSNMNSANIGSANLGTSSLSSSGMNNSGFDKERQNQRFRMAQFAQFPQNQQPQAQLYDSASNPAPSADGMEFNMQPGVVRYPSRVRNTSRQVHQSSSGGGRRRRIRLGWTKEETENLMQGCRTHGVGNWKKILTDPHLKFNSRTAVDLKDRFRTSFPEEYARLYPNARTHKQRRKRSSSGELGVVDSTGTTQGGQIVPAHPDSLDPATATLSSDSIVSADIGLVKINRKERRSFTAEEDEALLKGFEKYGPAWSRIQRDTDFGLMDRRSTDLRDRFRNAFPEKYIAAGYKGRPRKNSASPTSSASSSNQQQQQAIPRNAQIPQQAQQPPSQDLLGISSAFLQTQPQQQPSRYYTSNVNGR